MKTTSNILSLLAVCCFMLVGCAPEEAPTASSNNASSNIEKVATSSPLEADLCTKCGCCADCEDCCKGEKCDCGMQKGTALCCSGVKPADGGTYCKGCGFVKGSEKCCAESNETCSCGLAKGSPLCCKVKAEDHDHDHDHGEEGHDHKEGE